MLFSNSVKAMEISDLPLEEYIKLPEVVSINVIDSGLFRQYIKDKPQIKVGTVLTGGFVVAYVPFDQIQLIATYLGEFDDLIQTFRDIVQFV